MMRALILLLTLVVAGPAWAESPTLVRNVAVIEVDTGATRPGQDILVREGRIEALGPHGSIDSPSGARIVDAEGQFAIPGLQPREEELIRFAIFREVSPSD